MARGAAKGKGESAGVKVLVGLGNPGIRYSRTRHNVGARAARTFAGAHRIPLRYKKYQALFGEGRAAAGGHVKILLPMTYMNLSGRAVKAVVKDGGHGFTDLLILCDDADLPLGSIRIRGAGSDGGHRGLRSITECLGTKEFPRLRIGIGRSGPGPDPGLTGHVLGPFKKDEEKELRALLDRVNKAVLCWMESGIEKAMNRFNG